MPHAIPPIVSVEAIVPSKGTATTKPLAEFTRLAPVVSLYEPPATGTPIPASHPTTILFCSWMNAGPKHIDYYMRVYMRLFPQTRIILVTINTMQFLFHTESRRRSDIKSAVSALQARDAATERIFVHTLSNGGAKRLYNISAAYKAATGKTLPIQGWIIDSAPGIPKFRRDIYALTFPVRTWGWFTWLPFFAVILSTVSVVYVVVNWLPKWVWGELVWKPTAAANDSRVVPLSCVKGYVYSKEDLAIAWEDVENHATQAEEKGYRVEKMMASGAAHVQMFRGKQGEKGYWGFVEKVWGLALAGNKAS